MRALALAGLALLGAQQGPDRWAQVWSELEALRAGPASAAEAGALRTRLTEVARAAGDARGELLRCELETLAGRDAASAARRLAALSPSPFGPREQWFLADVLPAGAERAAAVRLALTDPAPLQRWQFLLAWNTAVDEARALRHAEATLPIQLELHSRYQAEWSALDLALTYKALGEREAADRVLAEGIAREEAAGRRPHALWESRAIVALGFGDEATSRDYLGRALALGSDDAGLLLARLDLMAGRVEAARRGFRALILGRLPPDWAWRGWGTTLLPAPFAAQEVTSPDPN